MNSHIDKGDYFLCVETGKKTNTVFTDHKRKGCYNACANCHEDKSTIGEMLQRLERARGGEKVI